MIAIVTDVPTSGTAVTVAVTAATGGTTVAGPISAGPITAGITAIYGGNYGYQGYQGRWRTGQRYPYYRDRGYYVSNYSQYGLPAPRRGYRYYRADNGDIVMAAVATGVIGLIIGGALAR